MNTLPAQKGSPPRGELWPRLTPISIPLPSLHPRTPSSSLHPSAPLFLVSWWRGGRGWSRCEGRLGQEGGIQRRGRQKSTSPCWHSSLSRTFWTSFYTHAHKQVFSGTMGSLQTTWPAVSMVVESMCVCLHLVTKKINERHLTFEIQSGFAAGLLTAGLGRASGYCSHLVSGDEEINEDLRDNQVAACQLGSGFLSLFRPPWVSVNYTVGHTGVKRLQWNTWRPRRTRTNSKQTPKNTVNIRDKCSPHTHAQYRAVCNKLISESAKRTDAPLSVSLRKSFFWQLKQNHFSLILPLLSLIQSLEFYYSTYSTDTHWT